MSTTIHILLSFFCVTDFVLHSTESSKVKDYIITKSKFTLSVRFQSHSKMVNGIRYQIDLVLNTLTGDYIVVGTLYFDSNCCCLNKFMLLGKLFHVISAIIRFLHCPQLFTFNYGTENFSRREAYPRKSKKRSSRVPCQILLREFPLHGIEVMSFHHFIHLL